MQSRVALVTGGTGGIGTSIVKRLAGMGHRVATNYRNEEKAKAWQEQMRAQGVEIALAPGDVSSPEDAAAMYESVRAGKRVTLDRVGIFADGVAVKRVGEETFKLCREYVDEILLVDTDEICAAIQVIVVRMTPAASHPLVTEALNTPDWLMPTISTVISATWSG